MTIDINQNSKELIGGIRKIIQVGKNTPERVRFHVPIQSGGFYQVTWGELLDKSTKIALYLDNLGITKDKKVSVYANTSIEWAFCIAALESCRSVFVPVYFSNTPEQTSYVINHSDAEIVFTEQKLFVNILKEWPKYSNVNKIKSK